MYRKDTKLEMAELLPPFILQILINLCISAVFSTEVSFHSVSCCWQLRDWCHILPILGTGLYQNTGHSQALTLMNASQDRGFS